MGYGISTLVSPRTSRLFQLWVATSIAINNNNVHLVTWSPVDFLLLSRSSSAICCTLKCLVFETPRDCIEQDVWDVSILISWGFIMVSHTEAPRSTSTPCKSQWDNPRWIWVKLATLAHVVHAGRSTIQTLFHSVVCPLMKPLQYVVMRETHLIIQAHLTKLRILHFAVVLHTIPDHTLEGMQTLIPQLHAWHDMARWWTLILSQTNLNFLVQYP